MPAQWLVCAGQAVSRTTYAAAFAVLGTTWGAGDGSTTFNLPDLRGRATFGADAMGGTAANRITAGVSGMSGALGSTGGDQHAQQDTLTASTTVTLTDPGHTHTISGDILTYPGAGGNSNIVSGTQVIGATISANSAVTGIAAAAVTTVTSSETGASQNMPPAGIINKIIYMGA